MRGIPRTPKARVEWLLDVATQPWPQVENAREAREHRVVLRKALGPGRAQLPAAAPHGRDTRLRSTALAHRNAVGSMLAVLAGYRAFPPPPGDVLDETQAQLRHVVEALAAGRPAGVYVPGSTWQLSAPVRRRAGARDSAPITRERDVALQGWKHLPSAIVLRFADDLDRIGADLLRQCRLETDGQRCGVIFLATRRQEFCSTPHAQAAAWQRYKQNRKDR
jgi:hypothetical protein